MISLQEWTRLMPRNAPSFAGLTLVTPAVFLAYNMREDARDAVQIVFALAVVLGVGYLLYQFLTASLAVGLVSP